MSIKHIIVTGGVVSSLGKGITAASLGRLLKNRGLKVAMQKFDPYLNLNPGMMSPLQHGEVFVTNDGGECDLDVGHYERFIDESLTVDSDITTGQIYQSVINKERNGDYAGGTVQVIPHITNEIKKSMMRVARSNSADIIITEIGGTVGDIESLPFLEAVRQVKWDIGEDNCLFIHVTLVPYIRASSELKTKPTQHSVKELRSIGIQPDIIVCRCEMPLPKPLREKIGLFANVDGSCVIPNYDADTLYEVPLMLKDEGLDELVCKKLKLNTPEPDMHEWTNMIAKYHNIKNKVKIALVGKYVDLRDAYISVFEALAHAGIMYESEVDINWVYSGDIDNLETAHNLLSGMDGIIVPGGFGERGAKGMLLTAQYARQNNIPYFGIGLGTQMAIVEFAQNVCLLNADSSELNPKSENLIIDLMEDYKLMKSNTCGTMRLGKYDCKLKKGTISYEAYNSDLIFERHRHRYELNPAYNDILEQNGMVIAGINTELNLPEIVEIPNHKWFVGVQFHAEFSSRPTKPHPLFMSFIQAALNK